MTDKYEPKPDDRSDNVEKLQDMVQDTIQNIEEAHETMEYSSGEQKEKIQAKNNVVKRPLRVCAKRLKTKQGSKASLKPLLNGLRFPLYCMLAYFVQIGIILNGNVLKYCID